MNRRDFIDRTARGSLLASAWPFKNPFTSSERPERNSYSVAAFYFPNYHVDPRNEYVHGKGWTEWELVKQAIPRFKGHQQPKIPQWGYQDESVPNVMAKKINAAIAHGISHFIFDWYYYDDGPFLQRCLDEGFIPASKENPMGFALMWANHNWRDRLPTSVADKRMGQRLLYKGAVSLQTFEQIADLVIEKYFAHPNYWIIDNQPFFILYDAYAFIEGMGGLTPAAKAMQQFQDKAITAGFDGIYLMTMYFTLTPAAKKFARGDVQHMLNELGSRSTARYLWNPVAHPDQAFPYADYPLTIDTYAGLWEADKKTFGKPVIPTVAMGWDSSPRTLPSDTYEDLGYPFGRIFTNNHPELFKLALSKAKDYCQHHPESKNIVLVNAWNEWTEGSYLEPDQINGMAFLEAIKSVFNP